VLATPNGGLTSKIERTDLVATDQLSAACTPYAPPMASPGYGKRSVPDQDPRRQDDFAQLPAREASIAAYIDRLPEGAAIDVKTLARELDAYGQQAVRTALNALSAAGHLRRVRERIGEGRTQWVFRTYFSRTARDDAWWAAFLSGGTQTPVPKREVKPEVHLHERPSRRPRSEAYEALAGLGRADARMTLAAGECAALEELAAEWLARGATTTQLEHALTAGLPPVVHCAGALARKRLTAKMPPEPVITATPPRRLVDCTACGTPGRPEALPGGLCARCRGESHQVVQPMDVRARVQQLRAAVRSSERTEYL
jgi:hypothetical protein